MGRHQEIFANSIEEPVTFWAKAAEGIDWSKPWEQVSDVGQAPFSRCFAIDAPAILDEITALLHAMGYAKR